MTGPRLADAGGELPVLLGGAPAHAERLILISRPIGGVARLREWTSADWAAGPTERESPVEALYLEIERAQREGRDVNQELAAVRAWLGVKR